MSFPENVRNAPSDGFLFTDAVKDDLLISTSSGADAARILIGTEKWSQPSALIIDESNVIHANSPVDCHAGANFTDGDVIIRNGFLNVIGGEEAGGDVLSVRPGSIYAGRRAAFGCNVEVRGNANLLGTLSVKNSAYADGELFKVLAPKTEIGGTLSLSGNLDAVGSVLVRPRKDDGSADRNKSVISFMNDAGVSFNRDVSITGTTSSQGNALVEGDFTVKKHGIQVLRVTADAVSLSRPLGLRGDADIRGNFRVGAPSSGGGGGSTVFEVRESSVAVNRSLRASQSAEIMGSSTVRGDFIASRNTSPISSSNADQEDDRRNYGLALNERRAFVNRHLTASCNLTVSGSAGVHGDLSVVRKNEVIMAVTDSNVALKRNLRVTGDVGAKGNASIVGNLEVRPGNLEVLAVDGTRVRLKRPLTVGGHTDITGNVSVASTAFGREGDELFRINDDHVKSTRDVDMRCNVNIGKHLMIGSNTEIGGNVDVEGDVDVEGRLSVAEDMTGDGDLTVRRDVDVGCNLRVLGFGISGESESNNGDGDPAAAAALEVTNSAVTVHRPLSVVGGAVFAEGDVQVNEGNFSVTPGVSSTAFSVNDDRVRVFRALDVDDDTEITGNLWVRGDRGVDVTNDLQITGHVTVMGKDDETDPGCNALVLDADKLDVSRDTVIRSNLQVLGSGGVEVSGGGASAGVDVRDRGNVRVRGGELSVEAVRHPDDDVPHPPALFEVIRDEFFLPEDFSSEIISPGRVNVRRDMNITSNLEVSRNLDVGGNAVTEGSFDTYGDFFAGGSAKVIGSLEAAFFPGDDEEQGHPTFLMSDEEGLRVRRDAVLESNLRVGRDTVMDGSLEIASYVSTTGHLTVRPEGSQHPAAFIATSEFITVNRDLRARCNLDLGNDLTMGGELFVGDDAIIRGDLEVFPGDGGESSTAALLVNNSKVVMKRPVDIRNRVSVSNAMSVTEDVFIGGDARIMGNLDVRPASTESPVVPSSTVLSVSDAIVDISRDLEARSNLDVGGSIRVAGEAHVEANTDIQGRLRVFPDPGSGLVSSGLTVDSNRVIIGRSLDAESNVIIGSNMIVRRDVDIGKNLTVEGDANVTGGLTANVATFSTLNVTGDTGLVGPVTIRTGSADGSMGYVFGNLRMEVDRDLQARCNLHVDSNVEVQNDAYFNRDATVSRDFLVSGRTDVSGELEVDGRITGHSGFILREGEIEVRRGGVHVVGGNLSVTPVVDGTRVLHVDSQRVECARRLSARCNLDVGCNLHVGSNVTLRTDLTVGRDADVDRDLKVRRNTTIDSFLDVRGGASVVPGFQVGADMTDPLFVVNDGSVNAFRDLSVDRDISCTGRLRIGNGELAVGDDAGGLLSIRQDAEVRGDLNVVNGGDLVVENGSFNVGGSVHAEGALEVDGTTELRDTLVVKVGEEKRFSVSSSNATVYPKMLIHNDLDVSGNVEVEQNGRVNGSLTVEGEIATESSLRVRGNELEIEKGTLRVDQRVLRVMNAFVRKYGGSYREVCRLRNADPEMLHGGAYAVRIDIVYDERDTASYHVPVRRDLTGGAWRTCLPVRVTDGGQLGVELEARSEGDVTEFRVVNVGDSDEIIDFNDSKIDEIPFSFVLEVAHNAYVPLSVEELSAEGSVPGLSGSFFPTTVLTEREINDNRGRVGVNVLRPREDLDVAGKVRVGDQVLAAPDGGSAAAPAFSFAGDCNTGVFRPFDDVLGFSTGGSERARIANNGYVGLGVQNPTEGLDVSRKIQARDQILGIPRGSANNPAFSFTGDLDTGVFRPEQNAWAVSTDGEERFRVTPQGRLGLGLTSPEEHLDVGEKLQVRDQVLGFSGGQGGASRPAYAFTGNSNTGVFQPLVDTWAVSTGGLERLRVADNGRVGIDLKEPTEALDVREKVQAGDQFLGFTEGTEKFPSYSFTEDSNTGMFRAGANAWAVSTGGAEHLRVSPDGNVGFDVKRPRENLDVERKAQAGDQFLGFRGGDAKAPAYSFTGDSNTGAFLAEEDTWAVSTGGDEHLRVTSRGRVGINLKHPAEELDVQDKVQAGNQFLGFVNGNAERPSYSFTGDLDTGVFRPEANNIALSTAGKEHVRVSPQGKVGVGLDCPKENLDVSKKVQARDQFLGFAGGTASSPAYSFTDNSNLGLFRPEKDACALSTRGKERMRVADNGHVGVNLTSPEEFLDVGGKVRARDQFLGYPGGSSTYPAFSFTDDINTGVFRPAQDTWGVATDGKERLRVSSDGQISIRQLDPRGSSTLLHLDGKIGSTAQFLGPVSDDVLLPSFSWITDSNTGMFHADEDQIGMCTAGVERMRLTSQGNLAIGRLDAGERLDVQGRVRTSSQFLGAALDRATAPAFSWSGDDSTGMFRQRMNQIGFSTGGERRVLIDESGRVGVNMSASNNIQLDVDGYLRASQDVLGSNIRSATTDVEGFVKLFNDSIIRSSRNTSETMVPTVDSVRRGINDISVELSGRKNSGYMRMGRFLMVFGTQYNGRTVTTMFAKEFSVVVGAQASPHKNTTLTSKHNVQIRRLRTDSITCYALENERPYMFVAYGIRDENDFN